MDHLPVMNGCIHLQSLDKDNVTLQVVLWRSCWARSKDSGM